MIEHLAAFLSSDRGYEFCSRWIVYGEAAFVIWVMCVVTWAGTR